LTGDLKKAYTYNKQKNKVGSNNQHSKFYVNKYASVNTVT